MPELGFIKNKYFWLEHIEMIVPTIHFLLTFLLERTLFIFSDNWSFFYTVAKNDYVSNTVELVIVYALSKIGAGIIICLLWKLIFTIIKRQDFRQSIKMFIVIFGAGIIAGLFLYPDIIGFEFDNYIYYSMAIRFLPTYWTTIYSGGIYAACMMVFPHPFSIFVFQWLAFVAVIAYIYLQMEKMSDTEKYKYVVMLLFIMPESYYIIFNPYRNCMYTILCLFYFAYLFFISRNREKEFTIKEMAAMAILSAFIMVWRSEGILIGIGGILFLILFAYYRGGGKKNSSNSLNISLCFFDSK